MEVFKAMTADRARTLQDKSRDRAVEMWDLSIKIRNAS